MLALYILVDSGENQRTTQAFFSGGYFIACKPMGGNNTIIQGLAGLKIMALTELQQFNLTMLRKYLKNTECYVHTVSELNSVSKTFKHCNRINILFLNLSLIFYLFPL